MINILTHARWCNHCKQHVNLETHADVCEFARLQETVHRLEKELKELKLLLDNGIIEE